MLTLADATVGCGGVIHGRSGTLKSPNFGVSAYGANEECEWEINVEPGYIVQASFVQRFDLENSTDCSNDFVQVLSNCFLRSAAPTLLLSSYFRVQ